MIDYLKTNKDIFNISGIERRLNMPVDTLRKAISGDQKLPKKWARPLYEFLKNEGMELILTIHTHFKQKKYDKF